MQLQAGYILESVYKRLKEDYGAEFYKVKGLLKFATRFEIDSNFNFDDKVSEPNSIATVYHNLIVRGLPAYISLELERKFAKTFPCVESEESTGTIGFNLEHNGSLVDNIYQALHIVDPRIDRHTARDEYERSWEDLGSTYEEAFLYDQIPANVNDGKGDYLIQLLESQREINSIIDSSKIRRQVENSPALRKNFNEQKTDFSLELPYRLNQGSWKGVVIEVDGSQHEEPTQHQLDKQRDEALLNCNWARTFRLKTQDFRNNKLNDFFGRLNKLINYEYFKIIEENYFDPIYSRDKGIEALQLILSPIAIARIQLALLRSILSGKLSLDEKTWNLCVFERDVPCAHLAIDDFKLFWNNYVELSGSEQNLPAIQLKVYNTAEFSNANLNDDYEVNNDSIMVKDKSEYDLYLDISMLQKIGVTKVDFEINFKNYVTIRSVFSPKSEPMFRCAERISWRSLFKNSDQDKPEIHEPTVNSLTFFLQNIFRKKGFRPGQIPILNRALQNQTVIGLLPTGGGKSLTYQLAAFLQPGFTLIVDPIKSLMKDQVDGLTRARIDGAIFINSMLKTVEEREDAHDRLKNGRSLLSFVSPERFQMDSFRGLLQNMYDDGHYFVYGVIDEVHCVSEWGHDFRTSYLSLGKNMVDYCFTNSNGEGKLPLFGLTATASFDVLADVQRELTGNMTDESITDEAIVRHETTNRDELQYIVREVNLTHDDVQAFKENGKPDKFDFNVKKKLGAKKQATLTNILRDAPEILTEFNDKSSLIVDEELIDLTYSENGTHDVLSIYNKVKIDRNKLNDFWSSDGKNAGLVFTPHKSWFFGVTDKYKGYDSANGVYDKIARTSPFNTMRLGTYMGADHDDEMTANQIELDNIDNQTNFVDNRIDVLVSTKAFGMGIDKSNIRFIAHINYPSSVESYIQEAGRAGRDGKLAVSAIVFNNQKFQYSEKFDEISPDFDILTQFYNNSFKGPHKEKSVIFELLSEVNYPPKTTSYELEKELNQDDLALTTNTQFRIGYSPEYFTVFLDDHEKNKYGHYTLRAQRIKTDRATVDIDVAQHFLSKLKLLINKHQPGANFNQISDWLQQEVPADPVPGIEVHLANKDIGEKFELTLGFQNDVDKIHRRIAQQLSFLGSEINPTLIRKVSSSTVDGLIEKLEKETQIPNIPARIDQYAQSIGKSLAYYKRTIQFAIDGLRDKSDTEKAIYRLSMIGVIDDYTVDFNANTFTITGAKKRTEDYQNYLRNYINKYYAAKRTEDIIESLDARPGKTDVQKILNFLIEFVYEEVAKKRYEAIKAMRSCCIEGLNKGNVAMKTWIHLYFNSKYARTEYTIELSDEQIENYRTIASRRIEGTTFEYDASLINWTDEGKLQEFDWIYDFIQITEDDRLNAQRDNLKHLRGACARILVSQPDNYVLRLLRLYSILILEEGAISDTTKDRIVEDFEKGFEAYLKFLEMDQERLLKDLSEFLNVIKSYTTNPEIINILEPMQDRIVFNAHVNWIKDFNEKFIDIEV